MSCAGAGNMRFRATALRSRQALTREVLDPEASGPRSIPTRRLKASRDQKLPSMQKYSVYIFAHDHEFGCSSRQDSRVEELEALLEERDRALEAARRRLREAEAEVQKAHSQRSAAIIQVEPTTHPHDPSAQASPPE